MKIMKTYITALILSFVIISSAHAIEWPQNPVLGVIGASFADCSLPMDTPLMGVGYTGCSYEALEKKLTKNHHLDETGVRVQSAAQAGSRSYDVSGTSWLGYMSQYNQLIMTTTWFDGVQRFKYLLISIPNDCLHSLPCTELDMQSYIDNIKQVVSAATQLGITVFINGYPEWEDLDLDTAALAFGLTNMINAEDYMLLKSMHESQLSSLPGVVYMNVWEENFRTIDGLHPIEEDVTSAADMIARVIKDLEK